MGQTLEQLENEVWGEPEYHSHLVLTCHSLRKKPIDQFTVEDLRIMIGQDIGTEYLMPKALKILEFNSFAEGNYYPGDLLHSIMKLSKEYWEEHPEQLRQAKLLASKALQKLLELQSSKMLEEAEEDLYPLSSNLRTKLIQEIEQLLAKTLI
jgi:CDI immunity proteins